jgi:hypothetical protein
MTIEERAEHCVGSGHDGPNHPVDIGRPSGYIARHALRFRPTLRFAGKRFLSACRGA